MPITARSSVACGILVVLGLVLGGSRAPAAPDLFDEIHARARLLEPKMHSVQARFTETTVSSLLSKPMVAHGTLLAVKPPRLVLRYSSPERKVLVMDGSRLVIAWPDRAERETVDITETMKRVNRYFASADAGELRRLFTVRAFPDPAVANTYQLDMVPRRKQIKQGLQRLQIWLDRESLVLVQMKMSFPGGDSDAIRLEDAQLNVPVDPGAFDVEAPKGR